MIKKTRKKIEEKELFLSSKKLWYSTEKQADCQLEYFWFFCQIFSYKIQNYWHVVKSDATQLFVVAPTNWISGESFWILFLFYRFYYKIRGFRDKPVDVSFQIVNLSEGFGER